MATAIQNFGYTISQIVEVNSKFAEAAGYPIYVNSRMNQRRPWENNLLVTGCGLNESYFDSEDFEVAF